MAPALYAHHQLAFTSKEGDDVPGGLPLGDSSSSRPPTYDSPALCGVDAQFPRQVQLLSRYPSPPRSFSGEHQVHSPMPVEHQQGHMGYQHHQTKMIQDEQSGQAMATMQSMQGASSFYLSSYLEAVDAGTRYVSGFPQFSQTGPFASQETTGILQTSMAPPATATTRPSNGKARARASRQDRREFPWTEQHTEVVRQGKRAGKSAPKIVRDLYQIDGVERTPNVVSKRWGKIRQGCINKHEMDSMLHTVCPEIVRMVYGELSKLDVPGVPNFGVQLAATERRVTDILRQHVSKAVREVVLGLFSNDVSSSM